MEKSSGNEHVNQLYGTKKPRSDQMRRPRSASRSQNDKLSQGRDDGSFSAPTDSIRGIPLARKDHTQGNFQETSEKKRVQSEQHLGYKKSGYKMGREETRRAERLENLHEGGKGTLNEGRLGGIDSNSNCATEAGLKHKMPQKHSREEHDLDRRPHKLAHEQRGIPLYKQARDSTSVQKHSHELKGARSESSQSSGGVKTLKLRVGGVTLGSRMVKLEKHKDHPRDSSSELVKPTGTSESRKRRHRLILDDDEEDGEDDNLWHAPPVKLPNPPISLPSQSEQLVAKKNGDNEKQKEVFLEAVAREGILDSEPAHQKDALAKSVEKHTKMRDSQAKSSLRESVKAVKAIHLNSEEYDPQEDEETAIELEEKEEAEEELEKEDLLEEEELLEEEVDEAAYLGRSGNLTARQRAMLGRDAEADSDDVEFPEGLVYQPSRKQSAEDTEADRLLKREEAARKRKQQMEKAARESQAQAIQKILGQDSTRKRREEKILKQRIEAEKEKELASKEPAVSSIRIVQNSEGTTVSWSSDVELPSMFYTHCRYPVAREPCAVSSCNNPYRYRDSKTKLPLCSLECYKALENCSAQHSVTT